MKLRLVLPAMIFLTVGLNNTAQATIYEQPPDGPGFFAISDTIDGSTGWRTYDNFSLSTAANLTSVTWWGSVIDDIPPYDNPAAYDVQNWEISIWTQNSGQPGDLLYTEYRTDAAVARELIAVIPDPTIGSFAIYRFDLTLTNSLLLQADTAYWLSILAFSPTGNPWLQWLPGAANGSDDASFQDNFSSGLSFAIPDNRAFALDGTAIPLPAAIWLLVSALAVTSLTQRRLH